MNHWLEGKPKSEKNTNLNVIGLNIDEKEVANNKANGDPNSKSKKAQYSTKKPHLNSSFQDPEKLFPASGFEVISSNNANSPLGASIFPRLPSNKVVEQWIRILYRLGIIWKMPSLFLLDFNDQNNN